MRTCHVLYMCPQNVWRALIYWIVHIRVVKWLARNGSSGRKFHGLYSDEPFSLTTAWPACYINRAARTKWQCFFHTRFANKFANQTFCSGCSFLVFIPKQWTKVSIVSGRSWHDSERKPLIETMATKFMNAYMHHQDQRRHIGIHITMYPSTKKQR